MEITKEHFDDSIKNLTDRLADLVTTKQLDEKLAGQTEQLQKYTDDAFAVQQELMNGHFKEIREQLDVSKEVERLKRDLKKIKKVLDAQGFKISWEI